MSKLADVALARMKSGMGEREPGYCQRWVRQCCQFIYGGKYNRWWQASAKDTATQFLNHPPEGVIVLKTNRVSKTRLGDLLYCTEGHGGFGHVGIRIPGNRVAENSVRKADRTHGAIGTCPLADFGFDVVVRLPEK